MTFVILSGGIDLSVGSVIAFSSVLIAVLVSQLGIHPLPAFAITLCVCTLFGATMGTMIHYLEVPPFIVTLAGMFLARGLTFLLTQDSLSVDHGFYDWIRQFYWLMPGGGRLTERMTVAPSAAEFFTDSSKPDRSSVSLSGRRASPS